MGRVGRPKVEINIDDVEFLQSLKFSWERIADIIEVSRSTLMCRIHDEGVVIETFSNISDEQLDHLVRRIKLKHPYDGERLMIGHLARKGVRVQRARLRGSIHRIDPINTAIRRSVAIRRRVYHSNGPNHTWHVDGNHKLIRWS